MIVVINEEGESPNFIVGDSGVSKKLGSHTSFSSAYISRLNICISFYMLNCYELCGY